MQIQIGSSALYNGITWSEPLALLFGQTILYNRSRHSTFPFTNYCGCGPVLVLDVLLFMKEIRNVCITVTTIQVAIVAIEKQEVLHILSVW